MNQFKASLESGEKFVITCELIPGRGFQGKSLDQVIKFATEAKSIDEIHALSLTDNAGGNPALSADILGAEIQAMDLDCIVHFSCKDMNRNFIESRAFALRRAGVNNLLVITGDYPVSGFLGTPKPVFDTDSVSTLHYLTELNRGLEMKVGKKTLTLDPSELYLGACVSPFKWTEGPSKMQYLKMEKKIEAGADYFITQLGYDSRKYVELIRYAREFIKTDVPILGSVYVLTAGAARLMNKGEIPGSFVSDEFLARLVEERKAEDKGKAVRLDRAAKQIAMIKGLGFSGAHIEGLNLKTEDVKTILSKAAEYGSEWEKFMPEFDAAPKKPYFVFNGGEKFEVDKAPLDFNKTKRRPMLSPVFWATRLLHVTIFEPGVLGFKFMTWFTRFIEHKSFFYKSFGFLERVAKRALFDCRQCDDCALFEMFYLCPESKCPKGMRQGPCGGSRVNGHCEVHEDKRCVWDMTYWRAKSRKQCGKLRGVIAPRDWELYETNSWVSYFQKYDHASKELNIEKREGASICD
ncbi:MAG: methylenetetrahydrofolate reductase [Spirochaetales bacterium]|jgi:methylenetetrahydrofolate reductase (NADPH)|nr:methylenetetrahydrofolate reductase [Spirochaetales bacterium]